MDNASLTSSASVRRIAAEQNSVEDRYYLHHHAPDHYQSHRLHAIRKHVSASSLHQLEHNHRGDRENPPRSVTNSLKQKRRKASMSTSQLTSTETPAKRPSLVTPTCVVRGHALMSATCSRLRSPCETCQHTVHRHHYLYCRNCPVVCHARDACIKQIPRDCPALDLGLEGWGESQQPIKVMDATTLDLEAVFLSGMLGLQANKCFECGCVLDPSAGRELLSDNGLNKQTPSGQIDGTEANTNKPLGLLPIKFTRSNSAKESMPRRPSPTRLLQDQPTRMRICYMTGKYYCDRCHWNDQWYVPGSIFLLNDTSMHPLSRSTYLRLRVLWDSAIYRIPSYWHHENQKAAEAFQVRTELHQMLRCTLACSVASALKECAEISEPSHLLGHPNYMRMCDVLEILNGQLIEKLRNHLNVFTEHIQSCDKCNSLKRAVETDDRLTMK
ncbi:hypothetical protein FGIG_04624 [Fasciola gigantica]|uniref:Rubicon Homology domain-containing protein n=1 Tax=Fasciola gigantica TaxID=46835 RepID=A0A504Y788_FASGI|nr:hypothetical protein FGIG_04624 [Fasciola gigantica]